MTNILITGGAGFVAGSLAEKLAENKDYFIVIVDNLVTGSLSKVPALPNCKFIKADVNVFNDIYPIMTAYKFDYVFHYAALVGVLRTLEQPVNVLNDIPGIKNILDLSKNTGVKRVFFSSSSEVYGEPVEFPQNEKTTPLNSRLPYAVVKNVGEAFLRSYQHEYGLDYTIFRFFNTYGYKQSRDFVVAKFLKAALNNEDITIYGDGNQSRTFCYIDDNIEATIKCFENGLYVNDVINLGNDVETTVLDLAKIIIKATNSKSKIIHVPALKEGDMTRRKPDITNMRKILNRDLVPLETGINKILNQISKL
ncbi:MAG: NAD-dependent epimerase/dehydratase family protein [Cytophagaceae bacterium]